MSNRNTLYAHTLIDELARSGLTAVCAAPGSRHTPLMLAFAQHDAITVYSHLDERSAAFFALGMALASAEPVALVCTSGTAGANMYPALIEAHQSRVPLIVLTADRPHELRGTGANQTIDQINMFGQFALWSVDMPLPEMNPSARLIRYLRTTANRAYATASGTRDNRQGVVHLNVPFRKPLEPTPVEDDVTAPPADANPRPNHTPYTTFTRTQAQTTDSDTLHNLRQILHEQPDGLIICGGHTLTHPSQAADFEAILAKLARATGYPVVAESYSQVRRYTTDTYHAIGGYDAFFGDAPPADVVLRFGDVPVSKALNQYLERTQPQSLIHVTADGMWSDDSHRVTHVLTGDSTTIAAQLLGDATTRKPGAFWTTLYRMEQATWRVIDEAIETGTYFDGGVVYDVVDLIPDGSTLFAGNSLPVRHLDGFGKPTGKRLYMYANRGASGIDGNISSALGAGAARPAAPCVAVLGDVTFYHDMNGLLAVQRCGVPITIVLLNNDGGGIFQRLPIRDYEPEFTEYFLTRHGLDFSHAANLYGLKYIRVDTRDAFRETFQQQMTQPTQSAIIEVRTNSYQDNQRRNAILQQVQTRIRDLNLPDTP